MFDCREVGLVFFERTRVTVMENGHSALKNKI